MADKDFKVVVLGGYGNFGSIIVNRLCTIAGMQVWVAGRDLAKAERLAVQAGCQLLGENPGRVVPGGGAQLLRQAVSPVARWPVA